MRPSRSKARPSGRPPILARTSRLGMVGRGDAPDVAVAAAAIEVAVVVEQHVLRPVDLAGDEDFRVLQPGRDLAGHQPLHALHRVGVEGQRIEIGRGEQPVAVLAELHVDGEDHDDDRAHRQLDEVAAKAGIHHRVVENVDRREADQHRHHRAATGHEAAKTDDQRRQHEELHADAGIGRRRCSAARQTGSRRGRRSGRPAHRRRRSSVLTRMPPWRAALRLPPTASTCQPKRVWRNITKNSDRDDDQHPETDRQGQHLVEPDPVPEIVHAGAEDDISTSCACEASV